MANEKTQTEPTQTQAEVLRRLRIKQAVETQRQTIQRARNKDIPGTEMWHVRGREIDELNKILAEFS